MILGLFDTETTGLDPKKDKCIEVALVRYDVDSKSVLDCYSSLIYSESNEAESVNDIPVEALKMGAEASEVWDRVDEMRIDAIVAHNCDFDRQWVPVERRILSVPWVDSCDGLTWPKQTRPGMNLVSLCLAHGLGVASAHRALTDCLL